MATEIRKQGRLGNQWQTVKVIDSPPCSLNGLVSPGGEESEPGPQPFVTVSLRPLNLYPWLLFNYVAPRAKFTPVSCSSRNRPSLRFYIARAQGAVTVRLDLWMNSRSLPPSDFLTLFGTGPPS